jgi:hypothetical protein
VAYRTFDRSAVEVLRLSYRPLHVLAGGRGLPRLSALTREGYILRLLPGGDFVVRIRHDSARSIRVEGAID